MQVMLRRPGWVLVGICSCEGKLLTLYLAAAIPYAANRHHGGSKTGATAFEYLILKTSEPNAGTQFLSRDAMLVRYKLSS